MTRALAFAAVAASSLALGCCTRMVAIDGGGSVTAEEVLVVEPAGAAELEVTTSAGNIRVSPAGPGVPVVVKATKSARTEADLSRVHPFARVEGSTVRVGYTVDPGTDGVGVSFAVESPGLDRMRLRTSAGSIEVSGADGTVDAETSAGNVTVSGRLRGACRLETSAGNVTASIPEGSRLRILGHTNAGSATSEHAAGAGSSWASASIVGTLGDGAEGTLEMKTSAGNLALRKLP